MRERLRENESLKTRLENVNLVHHHHPALLRCQTLILDRLLTVLIFSRGSSLNKDR